ncbi:MAG: tetratricopeptide repeat protein [Candidatus Cyclobacteriaceae bacterium M2_1C_046]
MVRYFWRDWSKPFRIFLFFLLSLAIVSVLFFCFTYFSGYELVINWRSLAYFQNVDFTLNELEIFPFQLEIPADNMVILQRFIASPLQVNLVLNHILLIFAFMSFVVLLTIASFLSRLWFLVSMAIWILILSSLRFEMLLFNGESGYLPLILVAGSTVALTYYFNDFGKNISFVSRALLNFLLVAVLALIIWFFSEKQYPFLFITSNSVIILMIISVIFILIISHEIVASFIYIITGASSGGKNNHVHFFIITGIYLINLILLYLYHINKINWNIWYINPYLLLVISSVLGLWGFKQREEQYKHIFPFAPIGGYLYLSLAIITFATIGFFYGSANDPAFEVIEEAIIYGHLSFGFLFLLYILANFSGPLSKGLKVNKILYRPSSMPYFMFRFAGLVGVFAFVIIAGWSIPFNYTFGAFFNQQGDYANVSGNDYMKEGYYQQSRIYAFLNHHANYALANYYEDRNQMGRASSSYIKAITGDPSPQAYVNLATLYENSDRYFDALFTLQEGATFNESGPVYNNLALLYSKTDIIDSTFYYLEKALYDNDSHDEAVANLEAFAAVHNLGSYIDSLEYQVQEDDILFLNNKVVRYNQQKRFFGNIPDVIVKAKDTNLFAAGLAYNYLINTVYHEDTANIKSVIGLSDKFLNTVYNENIRYGQSAADYYHFYVADAFRRLNLLANDSYTNNAKYFKMLGIWALEQEAPDQAAIFFRSARTEGATSVAWLEAFSLLLDNNIDSTLQVIDFARNDTINTFIIQEMAKAKPGDSDQETLFYLKYHLPYYDTTSFKNLVNTIKDSNLRAEAILSFSKRLFDYDLTEPAIMIYSMLADLQLTDQMLFDKIINYEMKLFADQGRIMALANYINDNDIEFSFSNFDQRVFYTGMLNAASGDSTGALKNFRWVANNLPFNEMEVVKATEYISLYTKDDFEVYNLLLNALELNPKSVRLLKAYTIEATRLGLDDFASHTLEELKQLVLPTHYNSFIQKLKELQEEEFQE